MKKFFSILLTAAVSLVFALSLSSCQEEIEPEAEVETGLPVEGLSFTFTTPMEEVVVTKASAVAETQILNFTMIFIPKDDSGAIVITKNLYNEERVTETNYLYSVSLSAEDLTEIHTGQYYLYAIANTGNGFISVNPASLSGMKKSQIDNVIIKKNDRQVQFTDASVLMSGKYCEGKVFGDDDSDSCNGLITLHSGENKPSGVIHLRRSVSKSIFTIKTAAGVEFNPVSYDIVNFAQGEYLFEKAGAGFWNGSIPGSVPTVPGVSYISRTNLTDFAKKSDGSIEFSFYMPENVQKSYPSSPATWTYASRETRIYSEAEHYGPFSYAPVNATYVVVRGSYRDANYTGDATYTIHLGDFGQSTGSGHFDNFTVRRNYKYNYAITVNSVEKIIAEAQSTSDSEQPGAEGNIRAVSSAFNISLDAHYETVLVSMDFNGADEYTVFANTHFGQAQVSRRKSDAALSAAQKNALDYKWISFAKPGTNQTVSHYPGESRTVDVFTLMDELLASDQSHYTLSGGKIYTVAYVNENYYETNPIAGGAVALEDFVNGKNRVLTATFGPISISRDEHSTFVSDKGFTIEQRPIRTFFKLSGEDAVANPFGVESIEETPSATVSDQGQLDETFGWQNFSNIAMNRNWSGTINANNNVYKTAGDAKNITLSSVMATGVNAFYQCLSRNRDENGNGTVEGNEIKWYLPSHVECLEYWYGMNGLEAEARLPLLPDTQVGDINYLTSTRGASTVWWANEGTAFGPYRTYYYTGACNVRCVRALGTYNQQTSHVYSFDGNNTIDVSGLSENCSRVGTMLGEYEPHYRNDQSYDLLPSGFQVAERDLQIGGSSSVIAITPRISATSNDDGTFTVNILNRSDLEAGAEYKISINGGTAQELASSYKVTPVWSTNQSTIRVKSVISVLGQDYASNKESTVEVGRIASSVPVPAPTGTDRIVKSGNQYQHNVSITNFDPAKYKYYYTTGQNSDSQTFSNRYEITSANFSTTSATSRNTIYIWVVPKNYENSESARAHSSATSTSSNTVFLGNAVSGVVYDVSGYTVGTVTNASNGEVSVPERNRFTLDEVKGSNLCASFYTEDEGGLDINQWRIPNEKELGLMFQYWRQLDIVVMTVGASRYSRSGVTSIFTIRAENSESSGNPYVVSTSNRNFNGISFTTGRPFVVRCVRDVAPRSDQGGGSGSGGSGDGGSGGGNGDGNSGGSGDSSGSANDDNNGGGV